MATKTIIQGVYEQVQRRNTGEVEFLQAVKEVLDSLESVLDKHPEYVEARILDRIVEPERQIMFRVPWQDDKGNVHVNRGLECPGRMTRVTFTSIAGSGLSSIVRSAHTRVA